MILLVFAYSITVVGVTDEIKLVFEIFGLAFVLSVFNYFFDEKTSFSILTGYLIKYAAVSIMVIAFGFVAGWFFPSNFWMAFIYVGVITVIVYALDSVKTEKDIEEINELVKISNKEQVEIKPLNRMHGWKVVIVLLIIMTSLFAGSSAGYFASGRQDSYFLTGAYVSAAAAVVLAILLFVYLAVYHIRRKKLSGEKG